MQFYKVVNEGVATFYQGGIPPEGAVEISADDFATIVTSPPAAPVTSVTLSALALQKRDAFLNGGIAVDVGTKDEPHVLAVDTSGDGRANILGLQKLNDLGHEIIWIESTGPVTITRSQLDKAGEAAGLYVSACYVAWANVLKAIAAGEIETVEAIDAFAWPATTA